MYVLSSTKGGRWKRFREPIKERHYVIGADCASGKVAGNETVGDVVCVESGEQVAILAGQIHPEDFADELEKAGAYYNTAEIAIERELFGAAVISRLKNRYSNLFIQDEPIAAVTGYISKEYGWDARANRTTAITWLQQDLGYVLSDKLEEFKRSLKIYDLETVNQLCWFVQNRSTGKLEAAPGKKDDRVIALAIANFMRRLRYSTYIFSLEVEKKKETWLDVLSKKSSDYEDEDAKDSGEEF
jgi:hypothetical protein